MGSLKITPRKFVTDLRGCCVFGYLENLMLTITAPLRYPGQRAMFWDGVHLTPSVECVGDIAALWQTLKHYDKAHRSAWRVRVSSNQGYHDWPIPGWV